MAQDLYFYKLKLFSGDYAAEVGREKVNQLLEEFLKEKDLEGDDELKEKLYEEVEVSLDVSGYGQIEKKLPKKFLSNARCFLMTQEVMSAIEEIVKEILEKKQEEKVTSAIGEIVIKLLGKKLGEKFVSEIEKVVRKFASQQVEEELSATTIGDNLKDCEELKDYFKLKELFEKNLLIVNIF